MNKAFALLVVLSTSLWSFGITVEEVLTQVKEKYSNSKSIEYNTTYELYKGVKSQEIHTSYEGYVYRHGDNAYQKIDDTESIFGSDYFLKINSTEKAVLLDVAQSNLNMEVDLSTILDGCTEKTVTDKGTYYSIRLKFNQVSENPFSLVYLRVNKADYTLQQLDLYYAAEQNFSEVYSVQDNAKPHLKIKFSNINTNPKENIEIFEFSNYISVTNNFLAPVGDYKDYELIDNRLN